MTLRFVEHDSGAIQYIQASKRLNHKEVYSPLGLFSTGGPLVEAEK